MFLFPKHYGPLFFLITLLLATACQPANTNLDSNLVREEMENRKIKRITTPMLMEYAGNVGRILVGKLDSLTNKGVQNAAVVSCNPVFKALADSLPKTNGANAARYAIRSSILPANPKEADLISAYRFSASANKNSPGDNLQIISDTAILFSAPILVTNSCLPCHGPKADKKKVITAPDSLTGYLSGQVIGLYSINLKKEFLIKHIKVKY